MDKRVNGRNCVLVRLVFLLRTVGHEIFKIFVQGLQRFQRHRVPTCARFVNETPGGVLCSFFVHIVLSCGAGSPAPGCQLVHKRNDVGYFHRLSTCPRLSGPTPRAKREHVPVAGQFVIVELANIHNENDTLGKPIFGVNESPVVDNLPVLFESLDFRFHRVVCFNCVGHIFLDCGPGWVPGPGLISRNFP